MSLSQTERQSQIETSDRDIICYDHVSVTDRDIICYNHVMSVWYETVSDMTSLMSLRHQRQRHQRHHVRDMTWLSLWHESVSLTRLTTRELHHTSSHHHIKETIFCQRALYKRLYPAKETYIFKEPTNHSHPIWVMWYESVCDMKQSVTWISLIDTTHNRWTWWVGSLKT